MLDLTRGVKLNPQWKKRYSILRFLVYLLFVVSATYFSYKLLFPSHTFSFFFETPDATKNTIVDPRDPENNTLKKGTVKGNVLIFDTALPDYEGDYSQIKINFVLKKSSPSFDEGTITLRKSYRAFFYPLGEPVTTPYENSSQYPSGSLLSLGTSVYITDNNNISPIDNAITFNSMGFDWADVIAASSDEIGAYEKGKLFTIASPHPNGTIFVTKEEGKYYLVDNGKKRELVGQAVIDSYLKRNPIIVDEKSLETKVSCDLKIKRRLLGEYLSCTIPLDNLRSFLGNNYQYEIDWKNEVKLKQADAIFQKNLNWSNLKLSLSNIKNKILYGANQPQ